ncbi:hypothetical protein SD960_01620 [Flavobacterium sp. MMLR14_040]|uniref:hypothetical protein n=1 Tax=Flavobacterium sp. MMLR14_040 TaxID=3093843 RepID=UPI002990226D|nr:hypothetical protein [Flavobacterium sp. MMLR14_040]MDW8848774.1 hypothetical protein [Flavobacterium sp. MMLR14_040]
MMVEIKEIRYKEKYEINEKLVYKDQSGNWQCHSELSRTEKEAFKKFAKSWGDSNKEDLNGEAHNIH